VTGKIFWAWWFLVLISAFSQFKVLGQFFAERYIYPAAVGFIAIMASLPEPLYWALIGAYILRTYIFIPVFQTNEALYKNGISVEPTEACNHVNLTDWYLMVQQDMNLAMHHIGRAKALDPADMKSFLNASSLWIFARNWPLALQECEKAIEMSKGRTSEQIMGVLEAQRLNIVRAMYDQQQLEAEAAAKRV
jgi:tetratricopeptide (TPR) repeat protein